MKASINHQPSTGVFLTMADEINEGNEYLKALKGTAAPPVPGAEAPAAERDPRAQLVWGGIVGSSGPQPQFTGAEKRRSPRYKCEGSVELREQNCEVRTWAAFTDISMHGCYVEAQATYPVGTVLQMKLEANGFRVESMGNVRVNYPYLGMGIAFVEMTEENRAHLRDLVGSVSRPSVIMGPGIASAFPARSPLDAVPLISNPEAAIKKLAEFFESRQPLMREDFLRILRTSQSPKAKP
jgi:hypothetical protein